MKRIVRDGSLVLLGLLIIILAMWCNSTHGAWDYTPPPKPAQDIIDGLIAVPRPILEMYGNSDRTAVMYNLVALRTACQGYEKRIKDLEGKVAELTSMLHTDLKGIKTSVDKIDRILDPNEVAK